MKKNTIVIVLIALAYLIGWQSVSTAQQKDLTGKDIVSVFDRSLYSFDTKTQIVEKYRQLQQDKDRFNQFLFDAAQTARYMKKLENQTINYVHGEAQLRQYMEQAQKMRESGLSNQAIQQYIITDLKKKNEGVLSKSLVEEDSSSVIMGSVVSQDSGLPIPLVFIFAFDLSDTTIAGVGIQTQATYSITGLNAGNYIIMATDLIGGLSNLGDLQLRDKGYDREFYQESETPDGATIVAITKLDTAKDVNFTLDFGGSIAGQLKNEEGDSLKNVVVVALKGDIASMDKFFTNIDIGLAMTDSTGHYEITGISSGDYLVRTISLVSDYSDMYLDEWYSQSGNVYSLLDVNNADKVNVTEPNQTGGIDFILEKPGAITGKIVDAQTQAPVTDVLYVITLDANSNLPQLAFFEYTDETTGAYIISYLQPGSFKLLAFVDPESESMYLSQFYDGKATLGSADPVAVVLGDSTEDIDFKLIQGGVVQGNITANNQPVTGEMSDFPVVLYENQTGFLAGGSFVQSDGSYQIMTVPPGQYKLAAIPVEAPYAVTYLGGGATFDDAANTTIAVNPGSNQNFDVDLEQGTGKISGSVTDEQTGTPLNSVFVFSYDPTGHVTSAAVSGMDIITDEPSDTPGYYEIPNLRQGNYTVRTFSIFSFMAYLDTAEINLDQGLPDFGAILANFHLDEWYDDVSVELPVIDEDFIFRILFRLQYQELGLLPFFQNVPLDADPVAVTEGQESTNKDFALGALDLNGQLPVAVEDKTDNRIPESFLLGQSYPNPVRRSELTKGVTINYQLPQTAYIKISVFNILGQKVATVLENNVSAGPHRIMWNGLDDQGNLLSTGVYFYVMREEQTGMQQMKKLVILN